ncbi:MAG: 23S rRNA (guanosine(2251)-2'-O)-methyltransferase RlmB [Chloroflexi bacterium]|nr:23S rRNA (guanosine(2251)-2'-O)-methyltransferase RlmB [Chloroflexota bacterium]
MPRLVTSSVAGGRPPTEWLYGRNAVREALLGPRAPRRLWLAEGGRRSGIIGEILQRAGRRGVRAEERHADELTKLLGPVNHQGAVLLAEPYRYADLDEVVARAGPEPVYLALDSLQDPQNFGTLLRSAEAAGVAAVLIPEHRQVGVTPAVVNASAGAVEHLAVCRVTNLARALAALKTAGAWVAGLEAVPEAQPLWSYDLRGPLALVVGAEGEGIGRLVRETCDFLAALPMAGRVASLNAAVAGSIALYEIVRQRADAQPAPAAEAHHDP